MKRFLAILSLSAMAVCAMAQEVSYGEAELAFIRHFNPDGSSSISRPGIKLPVTIRRIDARVVGRNDPPKIPQLPGLRSTKKSPQLGAWTSSAPAGATTVYRNDNPNGGVYFVADSSPSALDDTVHSAVGNGNAWKIVRFGAHMVQSGREGKFLVRWRGFSTHEPGAGAGVSAFSGEFFDGGFYLQRSLFPPGPPDTTYEVTIDLSLSPFFIVPNSTCFLAMQFREPHPGGSVFEDGEGPFTSTWNVFADNGPQVGTSDDVFWYDFPANGIYDETEIDNFGEEGPGGANFFFKVDVNVGATETIKPSVSSWFRGVHVSGNTGSLHFNENINYRVAKAGLVLSPQEAPAQLICEGFGFTTFPAGMRLDVDSKANTPGISVRIELWNYFDERWDVIKSEPIGTTDKMVTGFAQNPILYVDPFTGDMKCKVSYFRSGLTLVWPWTVSVDLVQWVVTSS